MRQISIPISDETIQELKVGDPVLLSGIIVTGRDAAHKWMVETFIKESRQPEGDDIQVYQAIKPLLEGGVIYHCGPVVAGLDTREYNLKPWLPARRFPGYIFTPWAGQPH